MCKQKIQKESEEAQRRAQEQQILSNQAFLDFGRSFVPKFQEREAQENAYFRDQVDPFLRSYAQTGFGPGERERLRNVVREDVGRSFQNAERGALGRASMSGYNADAPSGVNPYIQMQLGRGRGEAASTGLRNIEQMGAERRYGTIGPMLSRAQFFNPMGYVQAAYGGRAGAVQQPQIADSFWGKLGSAAATGIGGAISSAAGGAMTGGLGALGMPGMGGGMSPLQQYASSGLAGGPNTPGLSTMGSPWLSPLQRYASSGLAGGPNTPGI